MNEGRFAYLHPDFCPYSLAERLWTLHITFHSLRKLFGQTLRRSYKIRATYRKPEQMEHTFLSLNKSVPQKLSVPIMWLTLGQQIFPCLPIAICLSFFFPTVSTHCFKHMLPLMCQERNLWITPFMYDGMADWMEPERAPLAVIHTSVFS